MHKSIKLLSSLAIAVTLTACGSVHNKQPVSETLSFAPAIDVTYSEVNQNIKENVGLYVRWGGQIISSEQVGDITQLTVFNYPLSREGQPIPISSENFKSGRFIVEVVDYDQESTPRFLTVYGQVSGEKTLINGPKTLTIPVITAEDSKQWQGEQHINDRRGVAYYSLGVNTGHFNSYNRFGFNRGFNRFNRVGFNRYNRFGYNRFGFSSRSRFGGRSSYYRY